MKYQVELSIVGACGGYSKIPAKHAPAVGNSVLNSPINNLGSGSLSCFRSASNVDQSYQFVGSFQKSMSACAPVSDCRIALRRPQLE